MNSIPKEANFLAESGGSGSGYGGGWDSVQRFDHGSGRTWVLGATGSNSGSSGGEGPSPSLVLSEQDADLYWGKSGVETSLFFPRLCRALGFCRPVWAIPAGPPSRSALPLSPRLPLFISLSREPRTFLGVDGMCAMRMLVGGSIGTL